MLTDVVALMALTIGTTALTIQQPRVLAPQQQMSHGISSWVSPSYFGTSQSLLLALSTGGDPAAAAEEATPPSFVSVVDNLVHPPSKTKTKIQQDVVVRIIDANTVKLEKAGLVSFAAIQIPTPSYSSGGTDSPPECMSYTPASKAKQLLPPKTKVSVVVIESEKGVPRALIVTDGIIKGGPLLVNTELVRAGVAKPSPRGRAAAEELLPGLTRELEVLQDRAKANQVGLYQTCATALRKEFSADDQFEPLDRTVETQYLSDGGKQVVRERSSSDNVAPKNPGDSRGCSDFEYYEDALRWYDLYYPWYGDIAKLDKDGDGVPCPGLPHTLNQDRYRMKVPTANK